MSKNGDVVWANKQTWQRCYIDYPNNTEEKRKWYSTILDDFRSLKELKKLEDFRWLVKNGKITTQYELNPDDHIVAEKPVISETLRKEFVEDTLDKVRPEIHRIFEAACREARDEGYEQGWIQGNRHWTQEEKETITEFLSGPANYPPQTTEDEYYHKNSKTSTNKWAAPISAVPERFNSTSAPTKWELTTKGPRVCHYCEGNGPCVADPNLNVEQNPTIEQLQHEIYKERSKIVAYLREEAHKWKQTPDIPYSVALHCKLLLRKYAQKIENGEYLRDNNE